MKKYSLYFNKESEYVTIMLYFFDDFRKRNLLDQFLKIFDLFNGSQICARVVRDLNDRAIVDLRDLHIESIARSRSNEVLAIRFTQDKLGHFLNYVVQKDERTEVYFFDEVDWDIFINLKSRLDKIKYRALFVINDNNDTYVRFNINLYDVEYIKTQIDKILK